MDPLYCHGKFVPLKILFRDQFFQKKSVRSGTIFFEKNDGSWKFCSGLVSKLLKGQCIGIEAIVKFQWQYTVTAAAAGSWMLCRSRSQASIILTLCFNLQIFRLYSNLCKLPYYSVFKIRACATVLKSYFEIPFLIFKSHWNLGIICFSGKWRIPYPSPAPRRPYGGFHTDGTHPALTYLTWDFQSGVIMNF